ncbi:hypothetical protein [Agaribacterium haliotis]|uniref:hypothetical protein n=1 Tax=Agaribacterium haliotis TaxID=2013869 RepID=UPI000BB53B09|nr:hypothetical protein [Agaribacterium haliotis]
MHSRFSFRSLRLCLLLILLNLGGQLLGTAAHAQTMSAPPAVDTTANSPCHMQHGAELTAELKNKPEQNIDIKPPIKCCDGDCTMLGCHGATGIVSHFLSALFKPGATYRADLAVQHPRAQQSSIYKPPSHS